MKCHIPFSYRGLFPVYNHISLVRDKALISEITNNSFRDCDKMFIPEFNKLLKYAEKRYKEKYARTGGMVPLGT